jgi:hypothetical protein
MTSGGKCAPLKLIAIVVLPHDVPLVMEEDHTAKGLKRKLATKPDDDLAIEQRAHQAVLETKLGLQRALRVGAIGVLEPPLVDPCLEACDLGRLQIVHAQQQQQGVDGRVGAAAAGILLDGDAGIDDVPGVRPRREDPGRVVIARPVEHLEEPLFVLEGTRGIGRIAFAR